MSVRVHERAFDECEVTVSDGGIVCLTDSRTIYEYPGWASVDEAIAELIKVVAYLSDLNGS